MNSAAIAYLRVSDDKDGRSKSVDQQREAIAAWADRENVTVTAEYVDNGRSASRYAKKRRPEFVRMLEHIDANPNTTVVAWDLDRLLRNPRELEDLIDRAEKGLRVVTLGSGKVDLARPMVARMLTAVAADESDRTSKRVKRAKASKARQGKAARVSKIRAFGWTDGLTPNDAEADLIRQAMADVLAGASVSSIARRWNDLGIRRPRGASLWSNTTVNNVLTSPRNAGLVQHQGEVLEGVVAEWPAIVDRDTWERVRRLVNDPARRSKPRKISDLTGILRCGRCGATLSRDRHKSGAVVWRCKPAPHKQACGRLAIAGKDLEPLVRAMLFEAVDDGRLTRRQGPATVDTAELDDVEARLNDLAGMFADGTLSRAEWLTARERLEARRSALAGALAQQGTAAPLTPYEGKPGDLAARWETLDTERRNAIMRAVFVGITVAPATPGATAAERIADGIEWRA